MSYEPIKPMF